MVNFAQLQGIMQAQLESDRLVRTVDTEGATLEIALAEAATLLGVPVRRIEYEVFERGFPGFLGTGKKIWKIHAYKSVALKLEHTGTALAEGETETAQPVIVDKDGEAFVHFFDGGVWLKVTAPLGQGNHATMDDVQKALHVRPTTDIFEDVLRVVVDQENGAYVQVGKFERKFTNDSITQVSIEDQDMKAYIIAVPPGPGGCDLSEDAIVNMLKANRVTYGYREEAIKAFVDRPVYNSKFLVAEGLPTTNGKDAYVQYYFQTEPKKIPNQQNAKGSVDFKDMNTVQNVVTNQPLAKKIPAQTGVAGKTVVGAYLEVTNGKENEVQLGANVHLAEDGQTIVSDINGQVLLVNGKVSVEPVLNIQGNVNLKTGNIIFLGSVFISGNVEDGFSVKAEGNIEVKGTVGKAELEAEGNIKAFKGITGRNEGTVKAGKTVYAKFIENVNVEAGDSVVAADGIINSHVIAQKRIVCQGKRATIVGGHLKAIEEISAKTIGSAASGTETICEVGLDPKLKAELDALFEKKKDLDKVLEDVKLNINTLSKQGKLSPEKELALQDLQTERVLRTTDSIKLNEEITVIQEKLDETGNMGRVSASEKVLPGVKLILRDKIEKIRNEHKAVTFVLEDDMIRPQPYIESKGAAEAAAADEMGGGEK
ncbi:MAG: FapA family protein [Treponema sp.]|jgi:uncharacterized protein (DUF342 family)|nr:FapA family protein [Treponema sp.]